MTRGTVTGLEARVNVTFRLPGRGDLQIEFVVDTGFAGALTLPAAAIEALGLPFFQEMSANLANDESVRADVYTANILWQGRDVEVLVIAMGRRPLLGTALLAGWKLGAEFVDGGLVAIG